MRSGILFTLSILLTSCSHGVFSADNPALEEKKFTEVYEDVLVLENLYQTKYGVVSTYRNELDRSCQKVFIKHQVSIQDYKQSYDYYAHRPEQLKSINEQVIARLNKKKL